MIEIIAGNPGGFGQIVEVIMLAMLPLVRL